jgi:hypothetical protein
MSLPLEWSVFDDRGGVSTHGFKRRLFKHVDFLLPEMGVRRFVVFLEVLFRGVTLKENKFFGCTGF